MTARGNLRGHPMYFDERSECWRFDDTGEPTKDGWLSRPCGSCNRFGTPEGHDACLGTLPGVANACCGHGDPRDAYVQFDNGVVIRGFDTIYRPDDERDG